MRNLILKLSKICKLIFGYGILIVLFSGGLTFFGYLVALIIGSDIATTICYFIYNEFIPVIIYASTVLVLFGLLSMYMSGETALTPDKNKK